MKLTPKLTDMEFSRLALRYAEEAMARIAPIPTGLSEEDELSARCTSAALLTQLVVALQTVDFLIDNSRSAMAAFATQAEGPRSKPSEVSS